MVDRGDVLARDVAAGDLVDELVAAAEARGLEVDVQVRELAVAAGLPGELHLDLVHGLADRLAVGHLGLADVRVDVELAPEAVHDDVEVQLAHARDDGLPGLVVELHTNVGSSSESFQQPRAELVLVGFRLRLDRDRDDRRREADGLEHDGVARGRERVAGGRVLQAYHGHDVPVNAASRSSRWSACIWRMRPMRSLRPFVGSRRASPARSTPE